MFLPGAAREPFRLPTLCNCALNQTVSRILIAFPSVVKVVFNNKLEPAHYRFQAFPI